MVMDFSAAFCARCQLRLARSCTLRTTKPYMSMQSQDKQVTSGQQEENESSCVAKLCSIRASTASHPQ